VESYTTDSKASFPSNINNITSDITYYGVAIDGDVSAPLTNSSVVPIMNTDDCFRHFLLNTTNQQQLSAYLDQTADHILQPFPVGLSSDVGLFVANPAYAGDANFAGAFSQTAYHGTVVWSWQLAMMGAGLSRQLGRCTSDSPPGTLSRPLPLLQTHHPQIMKNNTTNPHTQTSAPTRPCTIRSSQLTTAYGI
jgi:hypothetical protein